MGVWRTPIRLAPMMDTRAQRRKKFTWWPQEYVEVAYRPNKVEKNDLKKLVNKVQ